MDCSDLNTFGDDDIIEPCRTCGIYFISNHAVIQPIFTMPGTGDKSNGFMKEIVEQLNAWNLEVDRNDGRPQYICIACINEFQKVLNFKRSCLDTQQQFDELDCKRAHNGLVIKKEIDPPSEETKYCEFIYIDSDEEGGSEEDGSRRVCAPFDIPHVPIKEEHTARVPQETQFKPAVPLVSNLSDEATFTKVEPNVLATANGFNSELFESATPPNEQQDSDDDIIKFTYEDDEDGAALVTLPAPIEDQGVYCKLCGHASATQERHNEHMSRIHMLKDCECYICGKKFANAHESRLRFHMKWHKLQKHLKCPICGFFCNSKDTLKEHKLAVHTRSKCEFCGKTMKHRQLQAHLNRHIQDHEEELARKMSLMQAIETPAPPQSEDLIQCAFCVSTFNDAEELQKHVLSTHRMAAEELPASAVESEHLPAIDTSSTLTGETELPELPTVCKTPIPDATNSSQSSSNSNSGRQEKSMCQCSICGKQFDLKIKLNRHLKIHTKSPF
ncbi:PREDICTED: zinc finger protein 287 [Drosophila arizonae]|uniref:Zinc finger protein 287 n=1 Tax=Drosophila arizonae TaxID=7263 RepID=A0ABM1NL23_DROAR|nr:PREDICTED: zinc finger protein 287 [Drosophila arizonae]